MICRRNGYGGFPRRNPPNHSLITAMKGNIPIPELPVGQEVWLVVLVTSTKEAWGRPRRSLIEVAARNSTGTVSLRITGDQVRKSDEIKPGLWGVVGRLEIFQHRPYFVVSEYRPISIEQYREHQGVDPVLPRAFTIDAETIALPEFRNRVPSRLSRALRLGRMTKEQEERYREDKPAEEDGAYRLGSLAATSGRLLSIAVHIGSIPGLEIERLDQPEREHVFGIDAEGREQGEARTLSDFLELMGEFDLEVDQLVGHNIIGFDLPFIFQRCIVNEIRVGRIIELADYSSGRVYDTMHRWWLGARNRVSLDDIAWALGLESSKSEDMDGSRIFDMYHAGRLREIREYNLGDVRLTRKVYERIVAVLGR